MINDLARIDNDTRWSMYNQAKQTNSQFYYKYPPAPPPVKYIHHQQWILRIGVDKSVSQSSHIFQKIVKKD